MQKLFQTFTKQTYAYSAFVILSASFNLQILNFLNNILGEKNVTKVFYILTICFFAYLLIMSLKMKINTIRKVTIVIIVFTVLYLMYKQTIFAEKTHFFMYGLLGFLAMKDTASKIQNIKMSLLIAVCFCAGVSILDELFQGLLPYRVYDIKDIILNLISTIFGIVLQISFCPLCKRIGCGGWI